MHDDLKSLTSPDNTTIDWRSHGRQDHLLMAREICRGERRMWLTGGLIKHMQCVAVMAQSAPEASWVAICPETRKEHTGAALTQLELHSMVSEVLWQECSVQRAAGNKRPYTREATYMKRRATCPRHDQRSLTYSGAECVHHPSGILACGASTHPVSSTNKQAQPWKANRISGPRRMPSAAKMTTYFECNEKCN